jgi:hypothetical protein
MSSHHIISYHIFIAAGYTGNLLNIIRHEADVRFISWHSNSIHIACAAGGEDTQPVKIFNAEQGK